MGLPMYVSPSLAHRKLPTKQQQQAPSLSEVVGASLFGPSQAAMRTPFTNRYFSQRGAALPEGHAANDVDYLLRTAESHLAERTVVDEIPPEILHHAQQHAQQQQQQQQQQARPDVPPRHQTAVDERRRRRSFPLNNLVQPRIQRLQQLQQLHRTRESSQSSSSSTRRGLQAGHLLNLNRVQPRASPTVATAAVATYATQALMPTSSHVQSIIAPGSVTPVLLTTRREERQRRREERTHSDPANQGDAEGSMTARQSTNTITAGTNAIDDIARRRVQLYRHVAHQRRFRGVTRTNTTTSSSSSPSQSSPSSPPPSLSSSTSSSLSSSPSSLGESNATNTNANGNVLNVTATPSTASGSTTALSRTLDPIFLVPMSTNLGAFVLPTSTNSSDYQRHYNLEPSSEGTYGLIAEPTTYISLIQSQPPQTILSPIPRRYSPAYAETLDVNALNRDVYGTSSESDSDSMAVVAGTDSSLPPIDERGAASGECC